MKRVDLGLKLSSKRTRKREVLDEMNRVTPKAALVEWILPYYSVDQLGRRPFALEMMLLIHFMRQWFGLSYPAMGGLV
jgi:IS5 family transposase